MLLYTKIITNEGVTTRKIFGTTGSIPAATDKEIVCKNAAGESINLVVGDTYLDDGTGGVKRLSDNTEVNVFVIAEDGTEVPVIVSDIVEADDETVDPAEGENEDVTEPENDPEIPEPEVTESEADPEIEGEGEDEGE